MKITNIYSPCYSQTEILRKWGLLLEGGEERMKKKSKLLTAVLIILFSFAVASLIWAVQPCIVDIAPSNPVVPPDQLMCFSALTTGEGCNDPTYTWEIITSDCTTPSSFDVSGGCYFIAPENCGCV